jgi:hypothetical protein
MWVAGLGVGERRALPGVSLTYLNAVNHFLTPWAIVEAGALALEPIPEASILADIDQKLASLSCVCTRANTATSYPLPSIGAGP